MACVSHLLGACGADRIQSSRAGNTHQAALNCNFSTADSNGFGKTQLLGFTEQKEKITSRLNTLWDAKSCIWTSAVRGGCLFTWSLPELGSEPQQKLPWILLPPDLLKHHTREAWSLLLVLNMWKPDLRVIHLPLRLYGHQQHSTCYWMSFLNKNASGLLWLSKICKTSSDMKSVF